MDVSIIPVTPFQQNCSLLVCEKTRRGAIVDPGGEVDRLVAHALERCDEIEKILGIQAVPMTWPVRVSS